VSSELRAIRAAVDERLASLRQQLALGESLSVKEEVIEGARRSLQFRVDRLERRVLAAAKNRDQARQRRLAAACASLYPGGKRQERAANVVPFLARYGMRLINAMTTEAAHHALRLIGGLPVT
jgi:uncharacterized protein YllA (UPF0747 family)